MRGKWAAGIPPRNFTWVIQDHLAVSERPGGSAPNHRRVRRQEEIIWLRVQGFSRVVSLLPSPHNLAAYDEGGVAWSHFPFGPGVELSEVLADLYHHLDHWLGAGERILLHQEELGDRVMGVVAGYLLWCNRLPGGPQAIAVTERLVGRQMAPQGRDVVAVVAGIASAPRDPARYLDKRNEKGDDKASDKDSVEEGQPSQARSKETTTSESPGLDVATEPVEQSPPSESAQPAEIETEPHVALEADSVNAAAANLAGTGEGPLGGAGEPGT